jgi:hypothetical protein
LALQAVGAELKDVVRTRLLVTKLDEESLGEIARAHRECIVEKVGVKPVCTLIGVAGLAHPDILCEIETDAFITYSPILSVTNRKSLIARNYAIDIYIWIHLRNSREKLYLFETTYSPPIFNFLDTVPEFIPHRINSMTPQHQPNRRTPTMRKLPD